MIGTHHKLTTERAEVIKALLKAGEHTHQQIADLAMDIWGVKISRELVTSINKGRRWNPDIRSFEMKKDQPKRSNDFRQYTTSPTKREFTDEDIRLLNERIEEILRENILK